MNTSALEWNYRSDIHEPAFAPAKPVNSAAALRQHFYDDRAEQRVSEQRRYYNELLRRYYRFYIPPGKRVLEVGCGVGDLLAAVEPAYGLGLDFSARSIALARERFPDLAFVWSSVEGGDFHLTHGRAEFTESGDPYLNRGEEEDSRRQARKNTRELCATPETFDYIIMSDLVNDLKDVQGALEKLRTYAGARTRLILNFHNNVWRPVLKLAERAGWKAPTPPQNWLSSADTRNLLHLAGWELITQTSRILCPVRVPLLSNFLNRWCAPVLTPLCLTVFQIARPTLGHNPNLIP